MVHDGDFAPQADIRVVGEDPEIHRLAFVIFGQHDFVPGPALELAPTLGIKLPILVDFLTLNPDLNDQIDTEDVEDGLLPLAVGQGYPEPDVFPSFTARGIGRKTNAGPLSRRILQYPLRNTRRGKWRVAPAILPTLGYRLRCSIGHRGYQAKRHQKAQQANQWHQEGKPALFGYRF